MIGYGAFISMLINFIVVGFVVFQLVKTVNRMQRPAPAAAPATKECPYCQMPVPVKATKCGHCTSDLR